MPNRKKLRKVNLPPTIEGFKPIGIPMRNIEHLPLLFEEYEAIRLVDYENLTHEEASKVMNVSRPTFTRIYDKARKTIARAFVEGKAIIIEGGNFTTDNLWYRCRHCHKTITSAHPIKKCRNCSSDEIIPLNPL